jgi:hypothetical protein
MAAVAAHSGVSGGPLSGRVPLQQINAPAAPPGEYYYLFIYLFVTQDYTAD